MKAVTFVVLLPIYRLGQKLEYGDEFTVRNAQGAHVQRWLKQGKIEARTV